MSPKARAAAKPPLFSGIRNGVRAVHRRLVFRRAMKQFVRDPDACMAPGNPVIADLIYGWGNEAWSALDEYIIACLKHARTTSGPVLECGSGLTTLLMGIVAQRRKGIHWALEDSPEWAAKVCRQLKRYKVSSVVVHVAPLKDHGEFRWYDAPLASMPDGFSLVVCDGPPGSTKGGRYGLVPVMKGRLKPGCVILIDDAQREAEAAIAKRWAAALSASSILRGRAKPYIEMTLGSKSGVRAA
jgi:hypothetical protein